MNYEEAERSLNTRLTQLRMAKDRVEDILNTNDRARIARQLETLRTFISETNDLRNTVEGMKIAQNVRPEDIEAWHTGIEEQIGEADREVDRLTAWLNQPQNNENRAEQVRMVEQLAELQKFPLLWNIVNNI